MDDAGSGNIGIVWVKFSRFQDTVDFVEKLEKWVVISIAVGDVLNKVRHFNFVHGIVGKLAPRKLQQVLHKVSVIGFYNVDTIEALGLTIAAGK